MRSNKYSIVFFVVMVGVFLSGCQSESGSDQREFNTEASVHGQAQYFPQAQAYNIGTVILQNVPTTIPIGGHVIPRNQVTLSARAPGKVVFIAGKEGMRLEKDQVVIGLDDEGLVAKRRAAWAQVGRSMSELQNAHMQLSRQIYGNKVQPKGGMGMPSMFDHFMTEPMNNMMGTSNTGLERAADITQKRTGVEGAQAAVVQAQSQLDELDASLKDKTSLSPGNAMILEKYVEVGDSVQPGQPLAKVADTDDLQVKLELPTRLLRGLAEGMMIPVQTEMGDRINAALEQIYPTADAVRHTVTVKLALPPGSKAAPGMYVQAQIPDFVIQTPAMPVIPSTAIVWRGGQPSVFIVNESNRSQMRMVRVGEDLGGNVTVLSGLRQNERYLISPPPAMRSGQDIGVPSQHQMPPGQQPMFLPPPNQQRPPAVQPVAPFAYRQQASL